VVAVACVAADLAPTVKELQVAGCESLGALAAGLNERGIPAARGGKWSAVQVMRLLEAASPRPFDAGVVVAGVKASNVCSSR
jgi:Recombinase